MDLAAYAELAVRLANAVAGEAGEGGEGTAEERELRAGVRAVFDAATDGDPRRAVDRLNALLTAYPIRPRLTDHDGNGWHLHLAADGTQATGAAAAMGLAQFVTEHGLDRLGRCAADDCDRVYLDTSTNRSRRYCGVRCAGRANVAAYRARRRASTVGEGQ